MAIVTKIRKKITRLYGRDGTKAGAQKRLEAKSLEFSTSLHLTNAPVTRDAVLRSVCRESYFEFVKAHWHTIIPEKPHYNWHIEQSCDQIQQRLERIFKGQDKEDDVCYNQCPGSTKSIAFSIMMLPWAWTRMPSFRFIGASHTFNPLALNLSRLSRHVVRSEVYQRLFPEIQLSKDQAAKSNFANTHGGQRFAVGSNGSVLGMHGHALVVDDPLDPQQALSETEMDRVNNWITGELLTRKVSSSLSVVFMVMQRLHQDDPSARMVLRPRVTHFCLPATTDYPVFPPELKKNYKVLPNADGKPTGYFDPIRFPEKVLEEKRSELGDYGYAGQFGQDPVPLGGGKFKTEKINYGKPPKGDWIKLVRSWDKAISKTKRSAYTAGVKLGLDEENRVWVLDVKRDRLDSYEREQLIRRTAQKDGYSTLVGIEEEPGSGGKESAQRTATKTLAGFSVQVLRATGDKETRADPFSVQVNMGNVWVPEDMWTRGQPQGWLKVYLDELRHWPHSKYKDQVDASAGAYTLLSRNKVRIGGLTPSKKYARGINQDRY